MDGLYVVWVTFVIVMGLGQFSPGPDMILLTRVALADGVRAGWATAGGIGTGLMVHAGVAMLFLESLTSLAEGGFLVWMYLVAIGYLLWLACGLLRAAFIGFYSKLEIDFGEKYGSDWMGLRQNYRRGLLCNLLNPKVGIFLSGVVLPFQQVRGDSSAWMFVLWATIVVEGLVLWCLWVRLLQTKVIKDWYGRCSYVIDGFFGVALLVIVFVLGAEVIGLTDIL